ncbi:unnamed protein product [Lymnaea stagnalis]|uniref:Fibronectin type-III domain-containing protein n=1 Tax=Lymnaea stagnalis TaxID=6523 RepID=A0AAV2IJC8_LYMST
MASILQNAAVAAVTKGLPSTYYTRDDRPNPVLQALDQELTLFSSQIKKRNFGTGQGKPVGDSQNKLANTLFEIWNKYEPRLPSQYFKEKLLEIGDFLVSAKEYRLALWQCYERYLQPFVNVSIEDSLDIETCQKAFFPDGLKAHDVSLTARALLGKSISMFQMIINNDPKLLNKKSIEKCLQLLSFLRMITQILLPREKLCWLVYNGTIHIYTISRYLLPLGHSAKVLEYLLWASLCMETSVPLLTVKYLTWRSTLYTAVCQCYYDCKADDHAEKFARRGLIKINELSKLELMSNSKDMGAKEIIFRTATVRMATMVFKRAVFETRRKPKGVFKPKSRTNYKDALNVPWPRTPSEKMLSEMFDGSSAQFLAILEALSNSNRRTLQTSPPASDNDPEILDVYVELMMAAQEILAGGAGNNETGTKSQMYLGFSLLASVVDKGSLLEMAVRGQDTVPLESVIQLLKLAYTYEHFDVFETLLEPVLKKIKACNDERSLWEVKALELLGMMVKLSSRKLKKQPTIIDEESVKMANQHVNPSSASVRSVTVGDDLLHLADVLLSIIDGQFQKDKVEIDIVVDASVFLWSKCKLVFQKYQTGSVDNIKFLQKIDNPSKWMFLLKVVHLALGWSGISYVDPALTAEVVLRLAMCYESSAQLDISDDKSGLKGSKTNLTDYGEAQSDLNVLTGPTQANANTKKTSRMQLRQAKTVLEFGLKNVSSARQAVVLNDGNSLADVTWAKELYPELFTDNLPTEAEGEDGQINLDVLIPPSMRGSAAAVANTVKDLHLELLLVYHRVCLKLAALETDSLKNASAKKSKTTKNSSENETDVIRDFDELSNQCNKNFLSKALLYAERAVMLNSGQTPTQEQRKLLEESVNLIQRYQKDELKIYSQNIRSDQDDVKPTKVPPPPLLLSRSDTCIVLKPALFLPESGEKVASYSIFARSATGPNVKARLSDYHFPGTGEQITAFQCEFKVSNLQVGERYLFAVAAYSPEGKLIGDGIGESTRPTLASLTLPVLLCWAYVCQLAYQVGCYNIAKQGCSVLWDYFVLKPQPPVSATYVTEAKNDFKLTILRLNQRTVCLSSPVLLRQFLSSIFIQTDISIREGQLFCDVICDKGPLYDHQIQRLHQCECLLIAVELAGFLNEASLALQAVVQMYGLLAPILYHKIPSLAVIQILQRCHAVLQEIPPGFIQKRQGTIGDSLNHMIACITFSMAKALRSRGENLLADTIMEDGKRLLKFEVEAKPAEPPHEEPAPAKGGKPTVKVLSPQPYGRLQGKEDKVEAENEELKALEAHIASVGKAAASEYDLSGSESVSILHSYISHLPSVTAYNQVVKFKRKHRYLEFLVQVAQKGLTEGLSDVVQEWCDEGIKWLNKRDELLVGPKAFMDKQPGAFVGIGNEPKKFAAAMVEYSGKKDDKGGKKQSQPVKKVQKYKPLRITENMSEAMKLEQEHLELEALQILANTFVDAYHNHLRAKKFRKLCAEEAPWRSQLNVIKGVSHFNSLLQKLEKREKVMGSSGYRTYRSDFLDQEWFTLETTGMILVGSEDAPKPQLAAAPVKSLTGMSPKRPTLVKMKQSGMEIAAAISISDEPLVTQPSALRLDTPPTYRSDKMSMASPFPEILSPLISAETVDSLAKTLSCFKRALVLAHRGQHWTLLQNGGRALWNCTHTALLRACGTDQEESDSGLITVKLLRSLVWETFYMAADCLLDMLVILQESLEKQAARAKSKGKLLGNLFESWMGDVHSERGGAPLKFDTIMDDTSIVDARWIRRLVLRTLEMLYLERKWEKLVDIALRFSFISKNRYAEQVIPLIVKAQRSIEERIKRVGGPMPPQPHFLALQEQLGSVIQAKEYLKAQLYVDLDPSNLSIVNPGSQIDPIGHGAYTEADAFRVSAVPLDTDVSLKTLYDTLSHANYTARALQHSRQLLCMYLAGQQNAQDSLIIREASKVDFKLATGQPHPALPPNKMKSQFNRADEIEVTPLPRSQLGTVINSYEKTIEILNAKNQKGLSAQAMHELGNIFFHAKNSKAAFQWWSLSLDKVLNISDALHSWREQFVNTKDISAALLDRCGMWGCVLAGVLASNIAQYIVTCDMGLRAECCLLAGFLFKALFRASLPHPTADRDYALYDIGDSFEVTSLVPGVDFLSDRFRCDGRQLVAALRFAVEELSRAQHNLFVLPLLTLYQYFTTFVCRDIQRSVDCRILKIRVLTDLHLFSEAIIVLQQLLNGQHVPQTGSSGFRHTESIHNTQKFAGDRPISENQNLKTIGALMDMRLSSNLGTLIGPHLTCHLNLAQAHLLLTLANTIPVVPKNEEYIFGSAGLGRSGKGKPLTQSSSLTTLKQGNESDYLGYHKPPRFVGTTSNLSIEEIKGVLLSAADQMVTTMFDVIVENVEHERSGIENLLPAELELIIKCQLEQAQMALQKHHAPMAARKVLAAIKMIQQSSIFKHHKPQPPKPRPTSLKGASSKSARKHKDVRLAEPEDAQFQYQNFQARSRLDAKLWLQCRLALVRSLMMEIRGMGEVKDQKSKVMSELADCRQYCAEGLDEAEVCNDKETQAQFLYLGAQLNIIEGKSLEHTISLLEDAIKSLNQVQLRSEPGEQLLATCITFKADLEILATKADFDSKSYREKVLSPYLEAHKIILNQMELLGEKIEHYHSDGHLDHHSSPVSPLKNVYLAHVQSLAQIKLRIGHAKARLTAKMIRTGKQKEDPLSMWTDCLGVLHTALEISQVSARREAATEAEILLALGRVQKMLVYLNKYQAAAAANTLVKAINLSFVNDHDLGLMRQAYLEIAMIYLFSSGILSVKDGIILETAVRENASRISEEIASTQKSKSSTMKPGSSQSILEFDPQKAAFLAIRCATAAANAQRARGLLIGDQKVTSQKVGEKAAASMPDFLALDLLGGYILGEKKKIFKNEIEEELSTMAEAQDVKVTETYDDQVNRSKSEAKELSWIHVLGYQSILQRLINSVTTALSSQKGDKRENMGEKDSKGPYGLDLGFISHAQLDADLNHDVVRYMLNSSVWSTRLTYIHKFLTDNLKIYATSCSCPFPMSSLAPASGNPYPEELNIIMKAYPGNLLVTEPAATKSSEITVPLPPASIIDTFRPADKITPLGIDAELSVQWYQPVLAETSPARIQSPGEQIALMYTFVQRGAASQEPGFLWVSLKSIIDLHDRLAFLAERAEITLGDKENESLEFKGSSQSVVKAKKSQRLKALSPKIHKDSQLEKILKQCINDCYALLGKVQENVTAKELPFELSTVNIKGLESIFDPSLGVTMKGSDLFFWMLNLLCPAPSSHSSTNE